MARTTTAEMWARLVEEHRWASTAVISNDHPPQSAPGFISRGSFTSRKASRDGVLDSSG
jgi:hypothetical protein